jgi:hypothetical protein
MSMKKDSTISAHIGVHRVMRIVIEGSLGRNLSWAWSKDLRIRG